MQEIYQELNAVCFIDILLNHTSIGKFFNILFYKNYIFIDSDW
jgi:hypothetical protein